jgi:hypothetical protein
MTRVLEFPARPQRSLEQAGVYYARTLGPNERPILYVVTTDHREIARLEVPPKVNEDALLEVLWNLLAAADIDAEPSHDGSVRP